MSSSQHRRIDYLFFGYYFLQFPTTVLFSTQGVYYEWLYPAWLRSIWQHYLENYRDAFLANVWKHPWYLSMCVVEHFISLPFFIWAARSYYYGAKARPWIVVPSIIYSTHTITVVLSMWAMALGADFSQTEEMAPRNLPERLLLCLVYSPFLIIPLINLIDSVRLTRKLKYE